MTQRFSHMLALTLSSAVISMGSVTLAQAQEGVKAHLEQETQGKIETVELASVVQPDVPSSPSVLAPTTSDEDGLTETALAAGPYFEYDEMDNFMKRYVGVQFGRPHVAYDLIRKHALDDVDALIIKMASEDISTYSADARLAHLLNLQNILVIQGISEDKSWKNLKRARGTGGSPGKLWKAKRVNMGSEDVSIADLEDMILTEFKDDPNVIYGLYQGVRGAPCLAKQRYTEANVRSALAENAGIYINSNGIVTVERKLGKLTPVYQWYMDDVFDGDVGQLRAHLRVNAAPNLSNKISRIQDVVFVNLNYNPDLYQTRTSPQGTRRRSKPIQNPRGAQTGGGGQQGQQQPGQGYGS